MNTKQIAIKYTFDLLVAIIGLILFFPILIAIAIIIKLKMPDGPVIFKQMRIGKDGHQFTAYKFRTMKNINYISSVSVAGESRITPLGQKLRRYKLDELPGLWNVIKGEMSLVGPRPDVPGYADCLVGDDRLILTIRPGITGPATLKYRNEEELLAEQTDPERYNREIIWPDKIKINKSYIENYSMLKDIKYICETIFTNPII